MATLRLADRKDFPNVADLEGDFEEKVENLPKNALEKSLGYKFWYCWADLIEAGAVRAFVGINPAGDQSAAVLDQEKRYPKKPYTQPNWNAFLDEVSPSNPYQESIPKLFEAMYGREDSERILRRTACFNVCPFRTTSAPPEKLSPDLWAVSAEWCIEVLEHIQPELTLIICMGNRENRKQRKLSSRTWPPKAKSSARSPWAVLDARFGVEVIGEEEVGKSLGYSLKEGSLKSGPSEGCSSPGDTVAYSWSG